jgi:hypothetical protein
MFTSPKSQGLPRRLSKEAYNVLTYNVAMIEYHLLLINFIKNFKDR